MKANNYINKMRFVVGLLFLSSTFDVFTMTSNDFSPACGTKRPLSEMEQDADWMPTLAEASSKRMKEATIKKNDSSFRKSVRELAVEKGYSVHDENGCYYLDKIGLNPSRGGYLADFFKRAEESSSFARVAREISRSRMFCFPVLKKIDAWKKDFIESNKENNAGFLSEESEVRLQKADFVAQELKNAMINNYKIHLMPYPDDTFDVLEELMNIFGNLPEVMGKVNSFKVAKMPYYNFEAASKFPIIVVYVTGKSNAQHVLSVLVDWFREEELTGMNKTPRHNQKVTDLIYWAQGDGDEKQENRSCFEEQAPCAESDPYVCFKADFTGQLVNHWLDISNLG